MLVGEVNVYTRETLATFTTSSIAVNTLGCYILIGLNKEKTIRLMPYTLYWILEADKVSLLILYC